MHSAEVRDQLVKLIGQKFIARGDVKAVQARAGVAYSPIRDSPFTVRDLRRHIDGDVTFGHYMLDQENRCKLFAFDLDVGKVRKDRKTKQVIPYTYRTLAGRDHTIDDPRLAMKDLDHELRPTLINLLRTVAEGLVALTERHLGWQTVVSFSGSKGLHVYVFAPELMPAADIREAQREVLNDIGITWNPRGTNFWSHPGAFDGIEIECFPKQDTMSDLGNLMRLPFGVHLGTGRESFLVDMGAKAGTLKPASDQVALLKG